MKYNNCILRSKGDNFKPFSNVIYKPVRDRKGFYVLTPFFTHVVEVIPYSSFCNPLNLKIEHLKPGGKNWKD